jgi:hypothetical protein
MLQIEVVANGYTVLAPALASSPQRPRRYVCKTPDELCDIVRAWADGNRPANTDINDNT